MLYPYITCILFAILAMPYSTATPQLPATTQSKTESDTQPNTESSANDVDLDEFVQRYIRQETITEYTQVPCYVCQQKIPQHVQREYIHDRGCEKGWDAFFRERWIYLAIYIARSEAVLC